MTKLTPTIKDFIKKNIDKSNRLLMELIWINFGVRVSHVAIGKYKRKIPETKSVQDKKLETLETLETSEEMETSDPETPEEKTNGYLEFIDNQEKYPVTITEFLNLLEKNKDHIYYQYFMKRLTKGSKSSRSEFMKFFEFIQDIF